MIKPLEPLYRHRGRGLLRAARIPLGSAERIWPVLTEGSVESWCSWLAGVWRRDDLAEAVGLASPGLTRQVQRVLDGEERKAKDVRKTVVAVTRYLLRESGRPTPFGLFAGITEVSFGSAAELRWGGRHHLYIRADSEWLA